MIINRFGEIVEYLESDIKKLRIMLSESEIVGNCVGLMFDNNYNYNYNVDGLRDVNLLELVKIDEDMQRFTLL